MEKLKEFMNSPKKTAILGSIGTLIMLIPVFKFTLGEDFFEFGVISMYHTYFLGLIVYFSVVLLRMFRGKGNIKLANYTILISLALASVCNILGGFYINVIVLLILELYLLNILLRKKTFITNKIALLIMVLYIFYFLIIPDYRVYFFVENTFDYVTQLIGYIFIMPYFYSYYNLLKEENKNGK